MSCDVQWELRYRSPLAPTRGVDTVRIKTRTTAQEEGERVANHWLTTERPSPSTRLIYVRLDCVMTTDRMLAELQRTHDGHTAVVEDAGPSPVQAASRAEVMVRATPDDMSDDGQRRGRPTPGRIGA